MRDVRYALRALARQPAWTAAAALTLALGIGANASMFTLVDRMLVRDPPHVVDPARVAELAIELGEPGERYAMSTMSYPTFTDLAAVSGFAALAAVATGDMVLGSGAEARPLRAAKVSGSYFALLGTRPALGRFFTEAEDQPPFGHPVAVVSHAFWQRELRGRTDGLGELLLDDRRFSVIGVAPSEFTGAGDSPVDVWVPLHAGMAQSTDGWRYQRGMRVVGVIARLRSSATAVVAEEGSAALRRADAAQGQRDSVRLQIRSLAPGWRERADASPQGRVAIWVAAMSVVVLLIAVVNVANLMLFRAAARQREVAIRLALGASRWQLMRQLLVESLLVALLGGGAALLLASWGSEAIRVVMLPNLPGSETAVPFRLLLTTGAVTILAGLLTGLLPAWRSRAVHRSVSRAPGAFLIVQSSLSVVLLVGAALFQLSLHRVRTQDFGFQPDGLLLANMRFANAIPAATQDALYRDAETRLNALPGVQLATVVQVAPFSGHNVPPISVPGRPDFPDVSKQVPALTAAAPDYFRVMDMRVMAGRAFTGGDREGSPLVVIVNQPMAEGLWPGESALGKCVRVGHVPGGGFQGIVASPTLPCREVVGVVNNARRRSIREEQGQALMQYYVPFGQLPKPPVEGFGGPEIWALLVRVADAEAMAVPVQRLLQSFAPGLPYADVRPLQDVLDRQMRSWQLGATMFTMFGVLALVLAAVGVYGVRAYAVAQRTREIGVRMALGADLKTVVRQMLLEGVRLTAAGVVVGAIAVLLLSRTLEPLLFETRAANPLIMTAVGAALLLVALLASLMPALRAARVDPNVALRAD